MKLKLTNFRCWVDKEIEIPFLGCVLLNGNSGNGKTTILNGILWTITGKLKKVSTFGKKFCKTEIQIEDVKITRTHSPSLLEVFYNNVNYTGEEAQKIINKIFGNHFETISYIAQDSSDSFVFKSPSEKFEFLEELLLKEQGIDKIVSRVKNEILKTKELSISEQAKLNTLKDFQKSGDNIKNSELSINECKITSTNFESIFQKVTKNLETLEKNLKTSENNLQKFEKITNLKERLSSLLKEKNSLLQKSSQEKLEELEKKKEFYQRNKEYNLLLHKYEELSKKYENCKQKREKDIETIGGLCLTEQPIKELIKCKNDQSYLYQKLLEIDETLISEEKCAEIEKDIENFKKELEEKNKKTLSLEQSLKTYKCPSCSTNLLFENNKLVIEKGLDNINEISSENVNDLKVSIKSLEKKIEHLTQLKILNDKNIENYDNLFTKLEKLIDPSEWSDIKDNLEKLYKLQKIFNDPTLNDLEKELKNIKDKMNTFSESSDTSDIISEEDFFKIIETISLIKDAASRLIDLNHNIEKLEKDDLLKTEISLSAEDIVKKIEEYGKKVKIYKNYILDLSSWEKNNKEFEKMNKLKNDIIFSEKSLCSLIERLKGLTKLKDFIKESEQKCIEEFINSLNFHANIYINEMFPDEDLTVLLKTIKKEKISLNFEVNYKQMIDCDLSILSGGERDRVNLAYTLAFSELTQNKILMLDECISSLDEGNASNVLRVLTENYKGLVICVCHQTVQGSFGHKIDL